MIDFHALNNRLREKTLLPGTLVFEYRGFKVSFSGHMPATDEDIVYARWTAYSMHTKNLCFQSANDGSTSRFFPGERLPKGNAPATSETPFEEIIEKTEEAKGKLLEMLDTYLEKWPKEDYTGA